MWTQRYNYFVQTEQSTVSKFILTVPETKGIPETLCGEFVSPGAQLHNVLTERRLRKKPPPPKTMVTRAAVETPHPGVSYNPSFKVRVVFSFIYYG